MHVPLVTIIKGSGHTHHFSLQTEPPEQSRVSKQLPPGGELSFWISKDNDKLSDFIKNETPK